MAKEVKEEEVAIAEGADLTGLIEVTKDGETIHVNTCALAEHKALGWKEVA